MKIRRLAVLAPFIVLAGCAGAGGGPSAGLAPLAHTVPAGAQATYVQVDSVRVDVDAGGQTFTVSQIQASTLDMAFEAVDGGVRITATFADFDGRVDNPMAGQQRFTEDAIDGPLVFTLTPRGEVTLVAAPEIEAAAQGLVTGETMAAMLFPRLPGRVVAPGDQWTDTIQVEANTANGTVRARSVVEYTVRGDTLVDGRSLLAVDFVTDEARTAEVQEAGMDMVQDVQGTGEGTFLWDRAGNRLYSQVQTGVFTGTIELPGAPFPLAMTIDAVSRMGLSGG